MPCVKTDTCGCNSAIGCSLAGHTRHGHIKIYPIPSQAGMALTVYHVFLVKLSFHPAQLCIRIRSSKLDGTHESLPLRITVKVVFIERHITLGRYRFTLLVFVTKEFLLEDRCARLSLTSITFAPLSYVHKSPIKAAQNEHKSARKSRASSHSLCMVHSTRTDWLAPVLDRPAWPRCNIVRRSWPRLGTPAYLSMPLPWAHSRVYSIPTYHEGLKHAVL